MLLNSISNDSGSFAKVVYVQVLLNCSLIQFTFLLEICMVIQL